jgi:hypothetical protein
MAVPIASRSVQQEGNSTVQLETAVHLPVDEPVGGWTHFRQQLCSRLGRQPGQRVAGGRGRQLRQG